MKTSSDVYFSAALMSLGYKLINVDRTDPRHMIFGFDIGEPNSLGAVGESVKHTNFEDIKLQWANEVLQVNARKYMESIKSLKSIIHSS